MYFGGHISSAGGIGKTLDRAEAMGADAVQLFTQSPRMWRPTTHSPESIERFKERRAELGIPKGGVVAHALYLVNLASEKFSAQSVDAMRNTLEVAAAIDADAVIFHVGSHLGEGMDEGMKRAVPGILELLDSTTDTTWLLMENAAGAGGTIGRSPDELVQLFHACGGHERLGICLDTCHLYVSGVDVTDPGIPGAPLRDLDERMGLDPPRALPIHAAAPLLRS